MPENVLLVKKQADQSRGSNRWIGLCAQDAMIGHQLAGASVQMTGVLCNCALSGSNAANCRILSQNLAVSDVFTYIIWVVFDIECGNLARNSLLALIHMVLLTSR